MLGFHSRMILLNSVVISGARRGPPYFICSLMIVSVPGPFMFFNIFIAYLIFCDCPVLSLCRCFGLGCGVFFIVWFFKVSLTVVYFSVFVYWFLVGVNNVHTLLWLVQYRCEPFPVFIFYCSYSWADSIPYSYIFFIIFPFFAASLNQICFSCSLHNDLTSVRVSHDQYSVCGWDCIKFFLQLLAEGRVLFQ